MFNKIFSITLLMACSSTMHASQYLSQKDNFPLATTPFSKEIALTELLQAGYILKEEDLIFKGDPNSGANFIDAITDQIDSATGTIIETRSVCYGPGGYVKAHTHDEDELFIVTRGGCKVHILETDEEKQNWEYWTSTIKNNGDTIMIPKNTIHALIAGSQGLCMHIARIDATRSVNFLAGIDQPWEIK